MKAKKILLAGIFVSTILTANAQTNSFPANDNVIIQPGYYIENNRMYYQSKLATGNSYVRGNIANNCYWDNSTSTWKIDNTPVDFSMLRFENNGDLGIFTHNTSGGVQAYSNDDIEAYRRLTIKGNGNVGIGTSDPGVNLSVYQSSSSTGYPGYPIIAINNPNTAGTAYAALFLKCGIASGSTGITGAIGALQCKSVDNGSQQTWLRSFGTTYPIYVGYAQTDLAVTNGKVGIGTINPVEKLSVEGTILAQKVKVSQAAADWPDYVFEKDYALMSLDSLENFLNVYKHLPNISSKAEIDENGIDLGGNQARMLQKIEELTLYLIDQNKKLDENNKQLRTQSELNYLQNKKITELELIIKQQQKTIKQLQDREGRSGID